MFGKRNQGIGFGHRQEIVQVKHSRRRADGLHNDRVGTSPWRGHARHRYGAPGFAHWKHEPDDTWQHQNKSGGKQEACTLVGLLLRSFFNAILSNSPWAANEYEVHFVKRTSTTNLP